MVPVLLLFLEQFASSIIPEHVDAFRTLYHIIGILRMGPEDAMRHTETLRILMQTYVEAIVALYGSYVKPKIHHMFHIVDAMEWTGKLLCCFVTERKHREIKAAAIFYLQAPGTHGATPRAQQ